MSINKGILYRKARETIGLIAARNPWFCISNADRTPARWAPAEIPIASSSRVSRTRVVSGSSSAILIRWTSQVSGRAETIFTPDRFNPLYTILEFSTETGMAADCSTNTYNHRPPLMDQRGLKPRLHLDQRSVGNVVAGFSPRSPQ